MTADFAARLIGMVVVGFLGWELGVTVGMQEATPEYMRWVLSLSLSGAALGLLLTPYFTTRPFRWLRGEIRRIPATDLFAGTVGLVIGLIISALLALPLSMLPGDLGKVLPFAACLVLGYLSTAIMVMRQHEMLGIFGGRIFAPNGNGRFPNQGAAGYALLDTSAIIDGRIADVVAAGFVQSLVVVPRFVLEEVQHIADSPDLTRRNRGRRGLDVLNQLRKIPSAGIEISDVDFDDAHDVDAKLIRLARQIHAAIITTDYNLNRVAELQGIRVLNLNELANAVRSIVLPGEEMAVKIIQEGKEIGQGVGYLDDGTMVVVEGGRRFLNSRLDVTVTRVLQTVAGRMIFAQPRGMP
ncbi:MAG: TRAM domain-containing protein [Chloroflexi bacterium]|nr:TRAM domain-containing protein [Chloroflexota bacterium]